MTIKNRAFVTMYRNTISLVIILIFSQILSSCSSMQYTRFEKRHYMNGYYVEKKFQIKIHNKTTNILKAVKKEIKNSLTITGKVSLNNTDNNSNWNDNLFIASINNEILNLPVEKNKEIIKRIKPKKHQSIIYQIPNANTINNTNRDVSENRISNKDKPTVKVQGPLLPFWHRVLLTLLVLFAGFLLMIIIILLSGGFDISGAGLI